MKTNQWWSFWTKHLAMFFFYLSNGNKQNSQPCDLKAKVFSCVLCIYFILTFRKCHFEKHPSWQSTLGTLEGMTGTVGARQWGTGDWQRGIKWKWTSGELESYHRQDCCSHSDGTCTIRDPSPVPSEDTGKFQCHTTVATLTAELGSSLSSLPVVFLPSMRGWRS